MLARSRPDRNGEIFVARFRHDLVSLLEAAMTDLGPMPSQSVWACPCLNVRLHGIALNEKAETSPTKVLLDQKNGLRLVRDVISLT